MACFFINFIMAGLARTAGVLYVALIELYGVSREAATTPFSIRVCVRNMTGSRHIPRYAPNNGKSFPPIVRKQLLHLVAFFDLATFKDGFCGIRFPKEVLGVL
ncbi:uncharacterized protein TNCV_3891641 [Trichonephila clavipes]|nr:uncharacterized protein TNCV_3891641 [Trichonephila clavipes]